MNSPSALFEISTKHKRSLSTQSNIIESNSNSSRRTSTSSDLFSIEDNNDILIEPSKVNDKIEKSGAKFTDKACNDCRKRKVKCSKNWPMCTNCSVRDSACDYGSMIPASAAFNVPQVIVCDPPNGNTAMIKSLSDRLDNVESDLRILQLATPPSFTDTVRIAFVAGSLTQEETFKFLQRSQVMNRVEHVSETHVNWTLARSSFSKALTLHLIDSFFVSCCAYLPCFSPWPSRLNHIRANLDNLDRAMQSAVSAFCAMGARASPHSALLGIVVASPGEDQYADFAASTAAGIRREQACRSIHAQSFNLVHDLEISYDTSIVNLEALIVVMQMLIFNEIVPRKSRGLLLTILNQFKEIQDSQLDAETKREVAYRLALPILFGDSVTSAYARKMPLIKPYEIPRYFAKEVVQLPNFSKDKLDDILGPLLSPVPSHNSLVEATTVIACWLAQTQRESAYLTQGSTYAKEALPAGIRALWTAVDQIHAGIVRIQAFLVNATSKPEGCRDDPCSDLHLRFDTRLDRDLMDVIYIAHVFIQGKRIGMIEEEGSNIWEELFVESERRVRKSLKLTAFYSQLYTSSNDFHMSYHLFYQLEILPYWTSLILQRYGEIDGPAAAELEVTETELDWFEQGLLVAAFYHPVAISRMQQLQNERRPARNGKSTPEPGTSTYDPAHEIRKTSTAGNRDGSTFSMPQAITNLNDLNTKRGSRRFDTQKFFNEGDSHAQIVQHFAELHGDGSKFIEEEKENGSPHEMDVNKAEEEMEEESSVSPMEEWLSPQGTDALFEAEMH